MSGFMDKAKQMAQEGMAAGKQGLEVGKQKMGEVQAAQAGSKLIKQLGAAVWAEQRHEGSHEEVVRILSQIDEHVKEHGEAGLKA